MGRTLYVCDLLKIKCLGCANVQWTLNEKESVRSFPIVSAQNLSWYKNPPEFGFQNHSCNECH